MGNGGVPHALVGVAVLVIRDGDGALLFELRKGAHGAGAWSIPGGHVDVTDESIVTAAQRELLEETGISVPVWQLPHTTYTRFPEADRAYVTLYTLARVGAETEAKLLEPEKCAKLRWCLPGEFPGPLFAPLQNLVNQGVNLWRPYTRLADLLDPLVAQHGSRPNTANALDRILARKVSARFQHSKLEILAKGLHLDISNWEVKDTR